MELNIIPAKRCNNSYYSINDQNLRFGIIPDMMLCAGSFVDGRDTCSVPTVFSSIKNGHLKIYTLNLQGDSGGPIQIRSFDYTDMYTQIGITSFGRFCGDKNSPGVYTKVSKYISWIESIVWPESKIKSMN